MEKVTEHRVVKREWSRPRSRKLPRLSARQLQVMQEIAAGYTYREVADRLHISHGTVETHVKHINEKLDVRNAREAIYVLVTEHKALTFQA